MIWTLQRSHFARLREPFIKNWQTSLLLSYKSLRFPRSNFSENENTPTAIPLPRQYSLQPSSLSRLKSVVSARWFDALLQLHALAVMTTSITATTSSRINNGNNSTTAMVNCVVVTKLDSIVTAVYAALVCASCSWHGAAAATTTTTTLEFLVAPVVKVRLTLAFPSWEPHSP
jgi:hypothetical protein